MPGKYLTQQPKAYGINAALPHKAIIYSVSFWLAMTAADN
jgi:hypothetical protein